MRKVLFNPMIYLFAVGLLFFSANGFSQNDYIKTRLAFGDKVKFLEWFGDGMRIMAATKKQISLHGAGLGRAYKVLAVKGDIKDACVANNGVYFTHEYSTGGDQFWLAMSFWPLSSTYAKEVFRINRYPERGGHLNITAIAASSPAGKVVFGLEKVDAFIFKKGYWYVYGIPGNRESFHFSSKNSRMLRFSPDGRMLAYVGKKEYSAGVVNTSTFNSILETNKYSRPATSICFSTDGTLLYVGAAAKFIDVFATNTGVRTRRWFGHTSEIRDLASSPNNKYLASASKDKSIIIWDVESGNIVKQLRGHKKGVNRVAFRPDGKRLISGSDDKTCILWDFARIEEEHRRELQRLAEIKAEKERRRKATPSRLTLSPEFDDSRSYFPNKMIDAGESSYLRIVLKNEGPGPAFEVSISASSGNPQVSMRDPDYGTFEEIPPNETRKVKIPVSAALDVSDGTATITIQAKEGRGYDARPVQLQIPVRHLDKPALSITSFTLNDGTSGLAKGNGNGIAENGEIVEIIAFVKNSGVGTSLQTTLELQSTSIGAEIHQGTVRLGNIASGETRRGKVVVAIPRTYTGKELRLTFAAGDTIGASKITRQHVLPMSTRMPVVAYDSRFLDHRGVQVDEASNGGNYVLEIVPRNEGQIVARQVQANVSASTGVQLSTSPASIGDIAAGASAAPMRFGFDLPRNYDAGPPRFSLRLTQADFAAIDEQLDIPFRRKTPNLMVREVVNTSDGNAEIRQGETVDIDVVVENGGDLDAEGVEVALDFSHTGIDFRERNKFLGRIPAGGSQRWRFSFLVKTGAEIGPLTGRLRLRQSDGFPGIEKPLSYSINPIGAKVVVVQPDEQPVARPAAPATRANTPPVVFLSLKNLPAEGKSYEPFVTLEIQIRDDKAILAVEPEIRVNGKLQPKEQGLRGLGLQERASREDDRKIRLLRRIELSEGWNDIEVRVYDADNEMGMESSQVEFLAQRTDIWAIVIGVGDYADEQIEDLKYTAADAQSFYDFLRSPEGGSVQGDHIRLLLNKQATRENILRDMDWITRRALKDDQVIIYMAMHGVADFNELYFLGYDSDPSNLLGTGIKKSDLEDLLQRRMKSNKVVWFADACHSGSVGGDPQVAMRASRASATNRLLREIAKVRNGLALFMSAQAAEYSQESSKWGGGHGVFTWFLLKGLRGEADRNRDNLVSVLELYDYVSRQVNQATDGKQNPILRGNYDREMKLSAVK